MKNTCFFLSLFFIFFGCERDNPESKDNFPIVFDHLNPNLVVEIIDTTIEFINPGTYYDYGGKFEVFLDMDSDGSNDIVFTHFLYGGKWGIHMDLTDMLVIGSSLEVSADVRDDTIFLCEYVDSTRYSDRLFFERTYYSTMSAFSCTHSRGIHKVTSHTYPQVHYRKDTLERDGTWIANPMNIRLLNYRDETWIFDGNTYSEWGKFLITEGLVRNEEPIYISVRKLEGNCYRYGWIKASVIEGSRIKLHEFAFEKHCD